MTMISSRTIFKPASRRGSTGGFTLIELMVSVVILVVILMSFGTILSQSQRVVSAVQRATQVNNAGAAICQLIRHDLMGLCKDGFLTIANSSNGPILRFIATNDYISVDGNAQAVAQIDYGLINTGDANSSALFRQMTLQDPTNSVAIQASQAGTPTFSSLPPTATDQLQKYLGKCRSFEVAYVANTNPGSQWVGNNNPWNTSGGSWAKITDLWPQAIRVRFVLTEYDDEKLFEVVVYTGY